MLTWEYPPRIIGGVSRHCYYLARSLAKKDLHPTVVTLAHPGTPNYLESEGVKIVRIEPPRYSDFLTWTLVYNYMMADLAISLHRKERFDLIHAHDWMTFVAGSVMKHALDIPMVASFHSTERGRRGGLPTSFDKMFNDIEWLGSYEAKQVIAVSNSVKLELINQLNVPQQKVNVVHNGMEFKRAQVSDNFKSNFALPNERILLFVGRLVWEKGVADLVEAAPTILREHPEAKIVVVGEGGMHDHLLSRSTSLGISDKVYVTGYLNDRTLHQLYRCADVLIVPSLYEPFGLIALEGMMNGLPVVASRVGGLREIITDGVDGLLIPPGDSKSIAGTVNRLLSDSALFNKISHDGKSRAKSFRTITMASETKGVYDKTLGLHPKIIVR